MAVAVAGLVESLPYDPGALPASDTLSLGWPSGEPAGPGAVVRLPLADGSLVLSRTVRPEDEAGVEAFFSRLSHESLRLRFMACLRQVSPEVIRELVQIDNRRDVALVAALPNSPGEPIVGMAGYHLDAGADRAEVSFAVADEWQNRGIGTFFLRSLARIARGRGLAGLDGQTFADNCAMRALLGKSGCPVRAHIRQGVLDFHIELAAGED